MARWGLIGLVFIAITGIGFLMVPKGWVWALKWALPDEIMQWEEATGKGWGEVDFTALAISLPQVEVRVDAARLPHPLRLVWARYAGGEAVGFDLGQVELTLLEGQTVPAEEKRGFMPADVAGVFEQMQSFEPWLSAVDFRIAELVVAGWKGERFSDLRLSGTELSATLWSEKLPAAVDAAVRLAADRFTVQAVTQTPSGEALNVKAEMTARPEEPLLLDIEGIHRDQPLTISAAWGGASWIPTTAALSSRAWPLPVTLPVAGNLAVQEPKLDLEAALEDGSYHAWAKIRDPQALDAGLDVDIEMEGDLEHLSVSRLQMETPGLALTLSSPVAFEFAGLAFTNPAAMTIDGDLAALSIPGLGGKVRGDFQFEPDRAEERPSPFRLSIVEASYGKVVLPHFDLEGRVLYPEIRIRHLKAMLGSEDEGQVNGQALVNLQRETVDARLHVRALSPVLASFDARLKEVEEIDLEIQVSGPWTQLQHEGRLHLKTSDVGPLASLQSTLSWAGSGMASTGFEVRVDSRLGGWLEGRFTATANDARDVFEGSIEELRMSGKEAGELALAAPAEWAFKQTEEAFEARLGSFVVDDGSARLEAAFHLGDDDGSLLLKMRDVDPVLASRWLLELPDLMPVAEHLEVSMERRGEALTGSFSGLLTEDTVFPDGFRLAFSGQLGGAGLDLADLEGTLGGLTFVEGGLRLPVQGYWDGGPQVRVGRSDSLAGEFRLTTEAVSEGLSERLPWLEHVRAAVVELSLEGDLEEPRGNFTASVEAVDLAPLLRLPSEVPQIRDLSLEALLDGSSLNMVNLSGTVGSGRLHATGAVGLDLLRGLQGTAPEGASLPWDRFSGSFELEQVVLGEWAALLPGFMRSQGSLSASLKTDGGFEGLSGTVRLNDLAMRSSLYTRTLEQIQVDLRLEDGRAVIEKASASVGPHPVFITGEVDFREPLDPAFALALRGEQVPVLRTSDMLLQADLDLAFLRERGSEGSLSGDIEVRDSFLLVDIDPLAARTASGAGAAAPPFFKVEAAPWSEMQLDLRIKGEKSLRLSSQYAQATLSLDFLLDGSLGQPALIGEVDVDSGVLYFPASRMTLSGGSVFITREEPSLLQLDLSGTATVASHVISMQARGHVNDPAVSLSATPNLSNAEIFRLLTTGSLKAGGFQSVGFYLGRGLRGPSLSTDKGLLDRLTWEVGRDVTTSGKRSIDIFFELTERFKLHGQYDKYDEQNLDFVWEAFAR